MAKGTIQDLLDSRVEDYFQDDKCSECGQCCTRFLALSNYEINTIKAYMNYHHRQYRKWFLQYHTV